MKVIRSKMIEYKEKLDINGVHTFFENVSSLSCNIILTKNGLSTDTKSFASLISFFLCLQEGDSYLMIAEGHEVDQAFQQLSLNSLT